MQSAASLPVAADMPPLNHHPMISGQGPSESNRQVALT
jgi:hypothetical protein